MSTDGAKFLLWLVKIASIASGVLLVLISTVLYETEEGRIQNKLEEWWVALADAEPRAITTHTAFVVAVAEFTSRFFDRVFGKKLLSIRSLGVSACFSLASLGLVCSPGLVIFDPWYPDIVGLLYGPVIISLIVIGMLPAAFGTRFSERLWSAGVLLLCSIALVGMHFVDWFSLVYLPGSSEIAYDAVFLGITIASDTFFIAATRWLLRRASEFRSVAKILVAITGNIFLAALLVFLPIFIAWRGFTGRIKLPQKMGIEDLIIAYVRFSTPKEVFLTTLASSNVLDAVVQPCFLCSCLSCYCTEHCGHWCRDQSMP
ncbi:MAG: hypothetical protein WA244_09580, partial [Candidatus Acidiferrales bacterium]